MTCSANTTSALIAAAGNSGRMGIPKPLIRLPDGRTFLEQILTEYFELELKKIVVVVNPTVFKVFEYRKPVFFNDVEWAVNPEPEKGRMRSLAIGLKRLKGASQCFIHNVDQPFASAELLKNMMRFCDEQNYVVPSFQGKNGHPVLINENIADTVIQECDSYPDLRTLLEKFERFSFESDNAMICENVNTPDDYLRVFGVKMKE